MGSPEPDRPALYVDKGYQSIAGYYPGAAIRQPARRRPNSGGLTEGELVLNKEINGTRIAVEHAIGMIKRYRITTRPFWGTPEELNDVINIISGLVNLNLNWDRIKRAVPSMESGQKKGITLTFGWSGAAQQPDKSLAHGGAAKLRTAICI